MGVQPTTTQGWMDWMRPIFNQGVDELETSGRRLPGSSGYTGGMSNNAQGYDQCSERAGCVMNLIANEAARQFGGNPLSVDWGHAYVLGVGHTWGKLHAPGSEAICLDAWTDTGPHRCR